MVSFDTRDMKGNEWTELHFDHIGGNIVYDYEVFARVLSIEVSDNMEKTTKEEFTRKSATEFEYALDQNGNVMKDTAGNDIKIFKDVTATLVKTEKSKTCVIRGEVETISLFGEPKGSLAKVPFSSDSKFDNVSYEIIGNPEALTPEQRKLARTEELPFPTESVLVKQCIENAKPVVRDIVLDSGNRFVK